MKTAVQPKKKADELQRPTIVEILSAMPPETSNTEADGAYRIVDFGQLQFDRSKNVRSRYDDEAAESLKATIRADGILQNLLVVDNGDGTFDGVGGFRRVAATESLLFDLAAEGDTELMLQRRRIPVKVLTAEQAVRARELQLIENLQREAVDPVDEARGYQALLQETNEKGEKKYTYDTLAAALGVPKKGPDYIRKRINLLNAPDFLLDAIRELGMSPRIGERVGKIANKKDREEMAKRAIKHPHLGVPMTLAQVEQMIREEFNVTLDGAEWDRDDATVLDPSERKMLGFVGVEGADNDGSCARCPHRTGCDPLLKNELRKISGSGHGSSAGIDPNICQDPRCYEMKAAATWRVTERLARDQGNRLMDKEQAKKLWENGAFQGPLSAQYIRRDYRPDYNCTGHFSEETMPTWQELLAGEKVSWILVRNPNKKGTVYLLERATAIELVEAKCKREGIPNPFANRPGVAKSGSGGTSAAQGTAADLDDEGDADESDGAGEATERHEVRMDGAPSTGRSNREFANETAIRTKRQRVWQRLLMQGIEDKLRQKPAAAMTAAVWEPLVCSCLDTVLACYDGGYLAALLGIERETWVEMTEDAQALAVMRAFEDDKTERSQMRWAILILVAGDMSGRGTMEPGQATALICNALGMDVKSLASLAERAVPDQPPSEEWGYYCDKCGAVCKVDGDDAAEVEAMKPGTFVCGECCQHEPRWFPAYDAKEAVLYEELKPRRATDDLSIAELAFLTALLNDPVKASKPNKHGVFEQCLTKQLSFDPKHSIQIRLAVDKEGIWYSARDYTFGTASGGTSPVMEPGHTTRVVAVHEVLFRCLAHDIGPEKTPPANAMIKPRASLMRLVAAVREMLEAPTE